MLEILTCLSHLLWLKVIDIGYNLNFFNLFLFFAFFLVFKYSCLHLPATTFPPPTHPHLLPSILTPSLAGPGFPGVRDHRRASGAYQTIPRFHHTRLWLHNLLKPSFILNLQWSELFSLNKWDWVFLFSNFSWFWVFEICALKLHWLEVLIEYSRLLKIIYIDLVPWGRREKVLQWTCLPMPPNASLSQI